MLALALLALITISSAVVTCPGTQGTAYLGCNSISAAHCAHYYELTASGAVTICIVISGACSSTSFPCRPICNGTTLTSDCTTISASNCDGYYSTDATGKFTCAIDPSTGNCAVPALKYYCTTSGQAACSGTGGTGTSGCAAATTQATCTARWEGPYNGQKNQCAWDATGLYCYVGKPCF